MIYILIAIILVFAYLIAIYQRSRGLSFWPSFFASLIALIGVGGVIYKILM